MSAVWEGYRARPRTLDGATMLHIVPSLREEPETRIALATAMPLQQAGARDHHGRCERAAWWTLRVNRRRMAATRRPASLNPVKFRRNVRALEQFAAQRTDRCSCMPSAMAPPGVHAQAATRDAALGRDIAARCAGAALARASLSRCGARGRAIGSSPRRLHAAKSWTRRYRIRRERDRCHSASNRCRPQFAPSTVSPQRIAAVRHAWAVHSADRGMSGAGTIRHMATAMSILIDVARTLLNGGVRNIVFVLAGPKPSKAAEHARSLSDAFRRRASRRCSGSPRCAGAICRQRSRRPMQCRPGARTADAGRIAAQAQAMGRPAIASDIGVLPETLLAPPRMQTNPADRLAGEAGQHRFARPGIASRTDARSGWNIGRWRRGRASSRNSCSRPRALPTRPVPSIPRCWRVMADTACRLAGMPNNRRSIDRNSLLDCRFEELIFWLSIQQRGLLSRSWRDEAVGVRQTAPMSWRFRPQRPLTVLIAVPSLDAGAADDGAIELVRVLARAGHRPVVVSTRRTPSGRSRGGGRRVHPPQHGQQEPVHHSGERLGARAHRAWARLRSRACPWPGAGLERLSGGTAHARAVPHHLVQGLPRTELGEAAV